MDTEAKAEFYSNFTAEYLTKLCTDLQLDLKELKSKEEKCQALARFPQLMVPGMVPAEQSDASVTKKLLEELLATNKANKNSPKPIKELRDIKDSDDIIVYLEAFEILMKTHKVEKQLYMYYLAPHLVGKSQLAWYAAPDADREDYDKVVEVLRRFFQCTPESYRDKFKNARKQRGQTHAAFMSDLTMYLRRWLQPAEIHWTDRAVRSYFDVMIVDQFLSSLPDEALVLRLRECKESKPDDIAKLADEIVLAKVSFRKSAHINKQFQPNKNAQHFEKPERPESHKSDIVHNEESATNSVSSFRCFKCQQWGHKANRCPNRQMKDVKSTRYVRKTSGRRIPERPSSAGSERVSVCRKTNTAPKSLDGACSGEVEVRSPVRREDVEAPGLASHASSSKRDIRILSTQVCTDTTGTVGSKTETRCFKVSHTEVETPVPRNCDPPAGPMGEPLDPFVHILVDGQQCLGFLDSGSRASIIDAAFFDELCSRFEEGSFPYSVVPSTVTVRGISGADLMADRVVQLEVSLHGKQVPVGFHIMDKAPVSILLGTDFLFDMQISVHYDRNTYSLIELPSAEFPFVGHSGCSPVPQFVEVESFRPDLATDPIPRTPELQAELDAIFRDFPSVITEELGSSIVGEAS